MHVRIVVEMVGCYLQFSKYVMYDTAPSVTKSEEVVKSHHITGVSQSRLSCVPLQKFHAGSIASLQSQPHGSCNLARVPELDAVAHILRI